MVTPTDDSKRTAIESHNPRDSRPCVEYIVVGDMRTEDDHDTCLRPLGLCELGGACESCWYRPDHPRFRE